MSKTSILPDIPEYYAGSTFETVPANSLVL